MFTPFELSILLHYHVSPAPHPSRDCLIWDETLTKLKKLGLVRYADDIAVVGTDEPMLTHKGHFYVSEGLCKVPLPEQHWVIPPANAEAVKRG